MGQSAKKTLVDGAETFLIHVLNDASNFEQVGRADPNDDQEITSTHVRDALRAQHTRQERRSTQRKVGLVISRVVLFALAAVVGVAGNNFPDTAAIAWFVGSLIAGLFILAITEMLEWSR